jgi:hypothetical protein
MKKELVRLLTSTRVLLLVTAYALPIKAQEAQPVLIFFNRAAGLFDAPIFGADGTNLEGASYTAQLYAGKPESTEDALLPVTPVTVFREGASAGYLVRTNVTLEGFKSGEIVRLQVRAWANEAGTMGSFEEAKIRGASPIFEVTLDSAASNYLVGLRSFSIFSEFKGPEPEPPTPQLEPSFRLLFYNDPAPGFPDYTWRDFRVFFYGQLPSSLVRAV